MNIKAKAAPVWALLLLGACSEQSGQALFTEPDEEPAAVEWANPDLVVFARLDCVGTPAVDTAGALVTRAQVEPLWGFRSGAVPSFLLLDARGAGIRAGTTYTPARDLVGPLEVLSSSPLSCWPNPSVAGVRIELWLEDPTPKAVRCR